MLTGFLPASQKTFQWQAAFGVQSGDFYVVVQAYKNGKTVASCQTPNVKIDVGNCIHGGLTVLAPVYGSNANQGNETLIKWAVDPKYAPNIYVSSIEYLVYVT